MYTWDGIENNGLSWVEERNKEKELRTEAYKAALTAKKQSFFSKLKKYIKAII